MRHLYSLFIGLFSPIVLLAFVWRYGLRRTLSGLGERFCFGGGASDPKRRVWFHAASVGEVRALESLLRAFPARFPGVARLLTTTTVTGKELSEKLGLAEEVMLAPLDLAWCVDRFLYRWKPSAAVFVETELWPNWIERAGRTIPLLLVNGRISDKTFGIYRRMGFFWRPLFARFFRLGVQSVLNGDRFVGAGAYREKVVVTGNLKYDVSPPDPDSRPRIFRRYGFNEGEKVLVCGSTHRGEEEEILRAMQMIWAHTPEAKLVIAPRHAERASEIVNLVERAALSWIRRSELSSSENASKSFQCLILDTAGELPEVYGLAQWAFVGGSFVAHGGQNPLEPARWGVPVFFGPHTENFREMSEDFLREGAARRVADGKELGEAIAGLLREPLRSEKMGQAARRVAESRRGAVKANLDLLEQALESDG